MDRKEIIDTLQAMSCVVSFIKVNGERRDMECTLDPSYLPDEVQPSLPFDESAEIKKVNENIVPAWDTNKNAWRSFRVNSVIKITTTVPEAGQVVLFEKDLED